MNRYIYDINGKITSKLSGNIDTLDLNTPEECHYFDSDADFDKSAYFYSVETGGVVEITPQPSPHHVFDYDSKEWSDPRTLGQIKIQKWSEIKQQRDIAEYGGFSFLGHEFDSDQVSQGRIITAAQLGVDTDWTLKNNEVIQLSAEQLIQLRTALAQHVATCHEKGRVLRLQINEAKTINEVQNINY